jgi:hypothetical protein
MGELGIGPRVFDAWLCDDLEASLPYLFKKLPGASNDLFLPVN